MSSEKSFRESAALLGAVKQLLFNFEKYSNISTISDIKMRVDKIQNELKRQIRKTFREVGQLIDVVADAELVTKDIGIGSSFGDACLVVDALGTDFRHEILEEFIEIQLQPYEQLFGADRAHNSLDQVDRRWAWFKRLLKSVESKFQNVFPTHWTVPLRICVGFYEKTRFHLVGVLTIMENNRTDTTDVHTVLKALQSCIRFEQEMVVRFKLQNIAIKDEEILESAVSGNGNLSTCNVTDEEYEVFSASILSKYLSVSFDRYLGAYVLLERQNLEEMLQKLRQEEDVTSGSTGHGNVYGSSINMFVFIKNGIKRCTALTTGQTFLSLSKEFKTAMQNYVEMLRSTKGLNNKSFAQGAESSLCILINTTEYCMEVVPQLEQMVKQKLAPSLKEKMDFGSEVDAFSDLMAVALKNLINVVMDRMDVGFRGMQQLPWGTINQVGEESSYCHQFHSALQESMNKIRDVLSHTYFSNFCMKLATEIIGRYQESLMKQKRISEMGSQQLLVDTYSLKSLLLNLHHIGIDTSTPAGLKAKSTYTIPSIYTRFVNNRIGHLEMVLKLVSTPEDVLVEKFRVLWPEGQPADLQMLMSMKGMKKQDQQSFLESLGLSMGAGSNSSSSSGSSAFSGSNLMSSMSSSAAAAAMSTQASLNFASSAITSSARNAVKWVGKN